MHCERAALETKPFLGKRGRGAKAGPMEATRSGSPTSLQMASPSSTASHKESMSCHSLACSLGGAEGEGDGCE